MSDSHEERLLRAVFAPARPLEPSAAEVARVVSRTQSASGMSWPRRPAQWRQLVAPGLAALVLLAGGMYAVPVTRAAIDEVAGTVAEVFGGYSRGEVEDAPGRALAQGEAGPEYFGDEFRGRPFARDQRVIAEAGGYKLYAYRAPSGLLSFDLGDTGVGMGFDSASDLRPAGAIYILGPGSMRFEDGLGHVPLFGLAADVVKSVELHYETGPPLRIDGVAGGFVLLAEPRQGPLEVVALDGDGNEVERESVDYPDGEAGNSWQHYVRPAKPTLVPNGAREPDRSG